MILEGLVTTLDANGAVHLAPMGPRMAPDGKHFLLRPFPTSHTFQNLKRHGEGVLHLTDDVLLLAQAALGKAKQFETIPAGKIRGFALRDACVVMEFRITSIDESGERMKLQAEIVHRESLREFGGFNRARHAVIEAAIYATRLHLLPLDGVRAEFQKWRVIVEKTGGPREAKAFAFLESELRQFAERVEGNE